MEACGDYTSCIISGYYTPGAYLSREGSRRVEIAPAASLVIKCLRSKRTRVEKRLDTCGYCVSYIIDGIDSASQEQTGRVKLCKYCTSCINGGTGSVRRVHRPSFTNSWYVST